MPPENIDVNIDGGGDPVTLIDADGKFTEDFTKALPGYLGKETLTHEDGSPIKMFDNTPSLSSLAKMAFDTKTAMGKKMENVIQKPAEGATEEDIAKYMSELDTARGVPTEAQNYEFPLGEGETEETLYMPEHITAYKDFAKGHNIPASLFGEFIKLNRKLTGEQTANIVKQATDAENKVIEKLKTENAGESLGIAGKMVFNALGKFNKNNPEFLAKMKESGVFESPGDFNRWKAAGVSPQNFQAWLEIAKELKISHSVDGSPGGGGGGTLKDMLPKSAAALGVK